MDLAFAIDLCKEEGAGQVGGDAVFCVTVFVQAFVKTRNVNVETDAGIVENAWNEDCTAHLFLVLVQVELLAGGVNVPVTPLNVYEYVRKYAEHRMLVVAEQPLHVSKTQNKFAVLAIK